MRHTYTNGMRVRARGKGNKGTITDDSDQGEPMVQWDDKEKYPEPVWQEARFLIPDNPEAEAQELLAAKAIQTKIDEATSSLEAAFKAWQEAAELNGDEVEYPTLGEDPAFDTSKFEKAFERTGWSTSGSRSLYC